MTETERTGRLPGQKRKRTAGADGAQYNTKEETRMEEKQYQEEAEGQKARQTNDTTGVFIAVSAILFATIVSREIAGTGLRLGFVGCFMAAVVTFLIDRRREEEKKKHLPFALGAAAFGVLMLSCLLEGKTAGDYIRRISSFFHAQKEEAGMYSEEERQEVERLVANAQQLEQIVNAYMEGEAELEQLGMDVQELSASVDTDGFWQEKEDPQEVTEILQLIEEKIAEDEKTGYFIEVKTDRSQAELFYKTQLSGEPYAYTNVIIALEQYGLDCRELGINEYRLACWDADVLMIFYKMRKSLEADGESDIDYRQWSESFNDYRAETEKSKDTFDYGDWEESYEDMNAGEIMKSLDQKIMSYYGKFILNFRRKG